MYPGLLCVCCVATGKREEVGLYAHVLAAKASFVLLVCITCIIAAPVPFFQATKHNGLVLYAFLTCTPSTLRLLP